MKKLAIAFASAVMLAACSNSSTEIEAVPAAEEVAKEAALETLAKVQAKAEEVAEPSPAMWSLSDEDTKIYLFGTVHVLPPDLPWRSPEFDAAFNESEIVYFEADVEDKGPELQKLVMQLGAFPPGESLYDHLSASEAVELRTAAVEIGIPPEALSQFKPWMAALFISIQQIVAHGQDPEAGVENTLLPEARSDGKVLRFFETPEQQLRFMSELSMDVQVKFLMEGVRQIKDIPDFLDRLEKSWISGDVEGLADLILEDQSFRAPEVYEAMMLNRNRNWTKELAGLLDDETGVLFVAVGAAHLAGEDSVVKMLEGAGLSVERVQ